MKVKSERVIGEEAKKFMSEKIQYSDYASRLQYVCLQEPLQWFNFFDLAYCK